MNTTEVYKSLTTPKQTAREMTSEEGLKQQQEAYEEQERQKWFQSHYTQRLMLILEKKKDDHISVALSLNNNQEQYEQMNEASARQLTKINTLNEIINYVTTGKI